MIKSFGQIQLVPYDSVTIFSKKENLNNPFAGGLNCPQFSEIDLNGDGVKDLVAFERNFMVLLKPILIKEWKAKQGIFMLRNTSCISQT